MIGSKKLKKTTIIILSLCVVLCSLFALFTQMFVVKAEGETPTLPEKLSTFVMDEGASIRCVSKEDETSGIRFTSSISASEFNSITNNGTLTYEFGMLIAKGSFGSTEQAISALKANENDVRWPADTGMFILNDKKFEYSIAIYNVQDTTKTFAALGYFTVGGKTYYANVVNEGDNIRSLFQVAVGLNTAVEKGLYEADDFETDYTNSLVDAVMTNEDVSLNKATYTAEIGGEIEISASVGGNKVKPVYVFGEEGIVEEVKGKFIAKKAGTTTVKAVVKGSVDYESVESTITVSKAPTEISNVTEFLALKNAKKEDKYVLANDITIKVNGTGSLEEGSDTYWNGGDTHIYCLIQSFAGQLDGNGHTIKIINTTAFAGGNFAGVFNNVATGAVIENVVFDILIKKGSFTADCFSSLIYKLEGTLRNCYIKTTIDGGAIGAQSAVIRTITTDATISNNIYELDGNLATVSRDIKYTVYEEKQIVIGAGRTVGGMFTCTDNRFNAKLDYVAYYNSVTDLLNLNNLGKSHVAEYKVTEADGGHSALSVTDHRADYYHSETLTDRDSKLEYGEPWTFDYENGEVKLCGQTVADNKIHIKHAAGLLAIKNSTENDEYVLDNDITITVNGTGSLEAGSDAYWIGNGGIYSLINSFAGKLNGNGHKITIINTTACTAQSFAGLFNNVIADAVIENVVFDIQIKNGGNFKSDNFSTLIYKLEGTLKNCYIKTTIDGNAIGSNSAVIRTITTNATMSNNIFEMDGKLATVSRDMKYAEYNEKQIIIGANTGMFTVNDSRFHAKLDNVAYYNSVTDLLNLNNLGKSHVALYKVTVSEGGHSAINVTNERKNYYHAEKLTDRDSKLEFGEPWTFDYANGELKLCGKIIVFD